jgi:hypothetical protein
LPNETVWFMNIKINILRKFYGNFKNFRKYI